MSSRKGVANSSSAATSVPLFIGKSTSEVPGDGFMMMRAASSQPSSEDSIKAHTDGNQASIFDEVDDGGEEPDDVDDTDDELFSDGFDSDESQKSHETRKKNRWFKDLFKSLDDLTVEQINEPERQWHCPACKGGPGAIDWYRGLLPLISHAKTKRSKRVKLHRELAVLLDEELKRMGTSAVPSGEVFGKWKGLEEMADKEIVWLPMVIIMNTRLEKDDKDKWIGMGNPELLDYFSTYSALKARHSYGPQGHRGMSVLIFEASAVGYAEAERLSKHFEGNFKDRVAWERNRMPFYSGGERHLYGYMAEKHDLDNFNQHSHAHITKKVMVEQFSVMTEKLRRTMDENRVVKLKTKKHHEQNKEEMDSQEQFFRDQIQQFYDARNAKEEHFEKLQQHEREKVTESKANVSSAEERLRRTDEFIKLQDKEMEEFVNKRESLIKAREERRLELRCRHWDEEMALEKEFDQEFSKLMEEYTPK
ncbi:Protein SUPPRESSOR OF GENE SILENCING [Orobanche gracilis]